MENRGHVTACPRTFTTRRFIFPLRETFQKRVVCITEVCDPRVLYKNWFLQFPAEKLPGRAYLEDAPSGSSPQVSASRPVNARRIVPPSMNSLAGKCPCL